MPDSNNTNTVKKAYTCTQGQLYIICKMAWNYFIEKVDTFSAFSPGYTKQTGLDALDAVSAAKKLKNVTGRNYVTSENRNKTIEAAKVVCHNWQALKFFIKKAYKGEDRVTNLEAAGAAYYTKASGKEWEDMDLLIKAANDFIDDKKADLLKNNNMPADFAAKFGDDAKICGDLIEAFAASTVEKHRQAVAKLEANNAIYEAAIDMMELGQFLFKGKKAEKVGFSFNYLYKIVKSKSPASLRGYILGPDNKKLPDVTVRILNTGLVAITNKRGYFCIGRVDSSGGEYLVNIMKDGYVLRQDRITFKAGTAKHLKVTLEEG